MCCTIEDHPKLLLLNILQTVITTWWTHEQAIELVAEKTWKLCVLQY